MSDHVLPPAIDAVDRQFLLKLARQVLRWVAAGQRPKRIDSQSPRLREPSAVFVTLRHRETGALRGCRGEIKPTRSLTDAVVRTTIATATDDPRFPAVSSDEVPDLAIQISLLSPLSPIRPEQIELGRHGVLLQLGRCSGLLLPQVPANLGLTSREEFFDVLCRKASLQPGDWRDPDCRLLGFETQCWGETDEP